MEEYLSSQLSSAYLVAKIAKFTLQGYALVRFYLDPGHREQNHHGNDRATCLLTLTTALTGTQYKSVWTQ